MSESQIPLAGFGPDPAPAPKGHKAFDRLVKRIHEARAALEAWASVLAPFQEQYTRELAPLRATCRTLRIRFVQRLDEALSAKGLTAAERRGTTQLVLELTAGLLAEDDDPALRALYERHAGGDFEDHAALARKAAAAAFEDLYGFDPETDPETPFDEILRRAAGQGRAQEEEAAQAGRSQSRAAADRQRIRTSIRALYRKLASALHPDREPDADRRERKTALMQKANHAYENGHLLPLLELRRELSPEAGPWAGEDEGDVKLYTKALRQELAALEQQVLAAEMDVRMRFGIDPEATLTPRNALRTLAAEIHETRAAARALRSELAEIADLKSLKRWLRGLRDEGLA
ncbi:J domain-containing protein [Acidiferrobacter sp.]|uniref:J domain-containing protein n=1 Tax=Acidiferrobacter sp. TaxID=1872107 RepID=UPI00261CE7EC|nr:J domain-containing protein [Acidiferrobacter sp.]